MKDKNNLQLKNLNVVYGVALIAAGVLLCALRSSFASAILTVAGVPATMAGVLNLVCKKWIVGGIEIALGVIVITCGWTVVDVALLVLGIVLCVYAIYFLITQISMFKRSNKKDKVFILLNPITTLIVGILLIVAKWYMIDAVFIVLGVVTILEGIVLMFTSDSADKINEEAA